MADIELVIKIPEEQYNDIIEHYNTFPNEWKKWGLQAIKNGTPLPEGHGRLKDFDKIEWYGCTTDFDCPFRHIDCKDCERAECDKTQVDEIPTIIKADEVEE